LEAANPGGWKESGGRLPNKSLLLVGNSGTSILEKDKTEWKAIDNESFHSISCFKDACWAIGGKGNLAKWGK